MENDWSKLAWGAWVDFQVWSSSNIQENIHLLMAVLYRPVISKGKKGKYVIEKYKSEEIEDRELVASISQDLAEKFKKYRELVQERKLKEAKSRKEPEVYHHFKKREN